MILEKQKVETEMQKAEDTEQISEPEPSSPQDDKFRKEAGKALEAERRRRAAMKIQAVVRGQRARRSVSELLATKRPRNAEAQPAQQPPEAVPPRPATPVPASPLLCPEGHPLEAFTTPEDEWWCSGCQACLDCGSSMVGCRLCDYDLCAQCLRLLPYQSAKGKALRTSSAAPCQPRLSSKIHRGSRTQRQAKASSQDCFPSSSEEQEPELPLSPVDSSKESFEPALSRSTEPTTAATGVTTPDRKHSTSTAAVTPPSPGSEEHAKVTGPCPRATAARVPGVVARSAVRAGSGPLPPGLIPSGAAAPRPPGRCSTGASATAAAAEGAGGSGAPGSASGSARHQRGAAAAGHGAGAASVALTASLCPQGHALECFSTPSAEWWCSKCQTELPANALMFGCRPCDYDLCKACSQPAKARRKLVELDPLIRRNAEQQAEQQQASLKPPIAGVASSPATPMCRDAMHGSSPTVASELSTRSDSRLDGFHMARQARRQSVQNGSTASGRTILATTPPGSTTPQSVQNAPMQPSSACPSAAAESAPWWMPANGYGPLAAGSSPASFCMPPASLTVRSDGSSSEQLRGNVSLNGSRSGGSSCERTQQPRVPWNTPTARDERKWADVADDTSEEERCGSKCSSGRTMRSSAVAYTPSAWSVASVQQRSVGTPSAWSSQAAPAGAWPAAAPVLTPLLSTAPVVPTSSQDCELEETQSIASAVTVSTAATAIRGWTPPGGRENEPVPQTPPSKALPRMLTLEVDFEVNLEKQHNSSLGLEVRCHGSVLMILEVKRDGLVAAWNARNKANMVEVGDCISAVNALSGVAGEKLLAEMQKARSLKCMIRRQVQVDPQLVAGLPGAGDGELRMRVRPQQAAASGAGGSAVGPHA